MLYLVCYDLSDNRVRSALARVLKGYGSRVQRSVFEINLRSPSEFQGLMTQLRSLTDQPDQVRFYRLCQNCREDSRTLDGHPVAHWPSAYIL